MKIDVLVLVDVLYLAGLIDREHRDAAQEFVVAVPNSLSAYDSKAYFEWRDYIIRNTK